jgi:type VI secretion system protein ImpL
MTIKSLLFLLFLYVCLVWVGAAYLHSGPAFQEFGLLWTAIGFIAVFAWVAGTHVFSWWRRWRARPVSPKPSAMRQPVAHEDDAALAALIAEANATLAKAPAYAAKRTPGPLYTLPWYLLIGPEGSGKTSTFLNSGLEPQLLAGQASSPVTSTRLCNIWLAKNAIFAEISGKAFNGEASRWMQLLKVLRGTDTVPLWRRLLTNSGKRLDLRGALGFCDVQEFTGASADPQRFEKCCRIWHERLRAIGEVFDVEFPVYHVVTKCDVIPFFPNFFRQLPESETGQVLGCTLPLHRIQTSETREVFADAEVKRLTRAFRALYQSLAERRLNHLAYEASPTRRPAIYEFPRELKRIRAPLVQFLTEAFRPDALRPGALLRGYYLTAVREVDAAAPEPPTSTDDWKTLDSRSLRSVDATGMFVPDAFGNSINRSINKPRPKRMVLRWSFVSELFHRVVVVDRPGQVGAPIDRRVELYRRWIFSGVCGVCGLFCLAFFVSWLGNLNLLHDLQAAAGARLERPATVSDLQKLDALRFQVERLRNGPGWWLHWGLYSGDRVMNVTRAAYFRRFHDLILNDLNDGIVGRLAALPATPNSDDPYDPIYQKLKTHLMISAGACPVEPALVSRVLKEVRMEVDGKNGPEWQALADRQIEFYAGELVYGNPSPVTEDVAARAHAQEYLRNITGVEQIYAGILANAEKALTKPQRLGDVAANYAQVLKGQDEISPVFTLEGWRFVEKASKERNSSVLGEACVLGGGSGALASIKQAFSLPEAIQQRYIRDYIDRWQKYLAGFAILPYGNAADAARKLEILSSNTSPLLGLFSLTANQTNLPVDPVTGIQKNFKGIFNKVESAVTGTAETPQQAPEPPYTPAGITRFFQPVHLVVAPGNGPWVGEKNKPYLDELAHLRTAMENIARANPDPSAYQDANQAYNKALDVERQMSIPFQRNDVSMQVERLLKEPIESAYRFLMAPDPGIPINVKLRTLCNGLASMFRKYPFRSSPEDVSLAEFSNAFGPAAGNIWKFRAESLGDLTVKDGSQWKAKDPAQKLQLTPEMLRFLNRAQALATAFFPAGATQPQLTYTLRPRLDNSFKDTTLEVVIDGQTHNWTSVLQKQFTWPAAPGAKSGALARLRGTTAYAFDSRDGLWGIFRLMADAEPRPLSSTVVEWKYVRLGEKAVDPIQPAPVRVEFAEFPGGVDVFNPSFFSDLQCPAKAVQ